MAAEQLSAQDFRPIGVTCVVTTCLEKMLLKRYRPWVKQVQSTDALDQLFGVEDVFCRAVVQGSPLIRLSDLSSCFTCLDASLASQLAT